MCNIENPMVVDTHWRHLERPEPKVVGECAGCQDDIHEGDDIIVFDDCMLHQDSECCYQLLSGMGFLKVAGE